MDHDRTAAGKTPSALPSPAASAESPIDIVVTVESASCAPTVDLRVQAPVDVSIQAVATEIRRAVAPDLSAGTWTSLSVDGIRVDDGGPLGRQVFHGSRVALDAPHLAASRPPSDERTPHVHVIGGPGAGRILSLRVGANVIGRARDADIRLDEPGVSRHHAAIHVSTDGVATDGVTVADLGSRNGTTLDGTAVTEDRPVGEESLLQLADCFLVVRPPPEPAAGAARTGDGFAGINRAPRLRTPAPTRWIERPTPPERPVPPRFALLAAALPLALGIVMWRLTGQLWFLLCTLLTPVLAASTAMSTGLSGRRSYRRALAGYARTLAESSRQLACAVDADARDQRAEAPDLAALATAVECSGGHLWVRRSDDDDFLRLRIGTSRGPSRVRVGVAGGAPAATPSTAVVPMTVRLLETAVLGIAGDVALAQSLARALLVQAAVQHSPRDLIVVVLSPVDRAACWSWVRWLPHSRPELVPEADCRRLVGIGPHQAAARVAEITRWLPGRHRPALPRTPTPRVLLVLDGARELRATTPGLPELLRRGAEAGVHAICLDADERLLPTECAVVAAFDTTLPTRVRIRPASGQPIPDVIADTATSAWTERLARRLAPLRDDTAADLGPGSLPRTVGWAEVSGTALSGNADDVELLVRRWQRRGACTQVTLGRGASGPTIVDLARDGPHLLVAGTTGSGKSELLRALAASLAAANRPDALSLLLIDYKGGAAFGACAALPHTVGLVTDLDSAETERALTSLQAELRRRERLLRSVGADSLASYQQQAAGAPAEPLGRLVIIVDEFATLNEELPDFVGGLVGVAQRGRSLGVHLVLATQRPQGVVRADIRANTNLRICLAVTRAEESLDVLETPDAADIARGMPGRAFLRAGPEAPTAFQAACISLGSDPDRAGSALRVSASPWEQLGAPLRGDQPAVAAVGSTSGSGESDLDRLVRAASGAAAELGIAAVAGPWLPTLPPAVTLATLLRPGDAPGDRPAGGGQLPPAPYGLLDLPAQQRQCALRYRIGPAGNLLLVGTSGSGRTTALRTLAGSLAEVVGPDDVHLYGVDFGGGLAPLSALPHCGAVVAGDDGDRLDRLLGFLAAEVPRRQRLLAAGGHANVCEQRATSEPGVRLPYLVLLLDGWEGLLARYQDADGGRVVDTVLRLVAEGNAAGIRAIVSADRSGLLGRLSAVMSERVVLRLADPADYGVVGLRPTATTRQLPPGRGWLVEGLAPVQIALLDGVSTGTAQAAALSRIAMAVRSRYVGPATRLPRRIDPLPLRVTTVEVAHHREPAAGGHRVPLGLGGNDLRVVEVDLADLGGRLLIGGPPRSGRSIALLTIAESLLTGTDGRLVVIAPRPSPLRDLRGHLRLEGVFVDPAEYSELELCLYPPEGPRVVLVDDADVVMETAIGDVLDRLLAAESRPGDVLIAAGATDALATSYRRWLVAMRRSRAGLVLGSGTPLDAELLGTRVPTVGARSSGGRQPAGRGVLGIRGELTPVQVATPAVGIQPAKPCADSGSRSRARRSP